MFQTNWNYAKKVSQSCLYHINKSAYLLKAWNLGDILRFQCCQNHHYGKCLHNWKCHQKWTIMPFLCFQVLEMGMFFVISKFCMLNNTGCIFCGPWATNGMNVFFFFFFFFFFNISGEEVAEWRSAPGQPLHWKCHFCQERATMAPHDWSSGPSSQVSYALCNNLIAIYVKMIIATGVMMSL